MIHPMRPPEPPVEDSSREIDQWFRVLAETTATAIVVFQEDRVLYVNPAVEKLTGIPAEELTRGPIWRIVHPDFIDLVQERARARLRGEDVPTRYEIKIVALDGRERWIDATSALIQLDGLGPAAMATMVTTPTATEGQLQRSGRVAPSHRCWSLGRPRSLGS